MNAQIQTFTPITQHEEVPANIVELLNAPLPLEAIKPHPTKAYLSTIKVPYVVERLNQAFGLNGWEDHYDIIEKEHGMVVVHGFLEVPKYGIKRNAFGGNDNSDAGDAYKGACTDALSKMASFLGIGMDVYKGLRDGRESPKTAPKTSVAPKPQPESQHPAEATAMGLWPTTVEGDVMKCYVLSVNERPGKFPNTVSLEVRHMKRDGSGEVGTSTEFTKVGSDFYQLVKATPQHNCTFTLEKKGKYLNITNVTGAVSPLAVQSVNELEVTDEDIPF